MNGVTRAEWLALAAQAETECKPYLAKLYRQYAQADRVDSERTARLSVPYDEREV